MSKCASSSAPPVVGIEIDDSAFPSRSKRRIKSIGAFNYTLQDKPSEATLDYWIDLARLLESGETVTAARAWLNRRGMYIKKVEFGTTGALVWLLGGRNGLQFEVTCEITTSAGRQYIAVFTCSTSGDYRGYLILNALTLTSRPIVLGGRPLVVQ